MTRGSDPGKDFDNQYNASNRRGREKAARGESHWADDKYLERINAERGKHAGEPKGCSDKAAALVAIGLAAGWGITEVIRVAVG